MVSTLRKRPKSAKTLIWYCSAAVCSSLAFSFVDLVHQSPLLATLTLCNRNTSTVYVDPEAYDVSHTHHFPVAVRRLHCMCSVEKGRGIVAVVRSRQVVAVHGSSGCCFQCSFGRDLGLWSLETGGRSMQVVVNTGFTVALWLRLQLFSGIRTYIIILYMDRSI